jgi:hypothetical protein
LTPKDDTDLARANTIKIIRAAVRLKHSINADIELNDVLPLAMLKFEAAVKRQQLPAPADIKKAVGL